MTPTSVMFKQLLEHNITGCDGQYFCHLCMCSPSSLEDVLHHIKEEKHQLLQSDHTTDVLKDIQGDTNGILIDNKIAIIILNNFICIPCSRNFKDLFSTLQHIESTSHIEQLTKLYLSKNCEENKSKTYILPFKSKLLKKRKTKLGRSETFVISQDTYRCKDQKKQSECVPLQYFRISCGYTNEDCEILIHNRIVKVKYHQLLCQLCYRCCLHLNDMLDHIKSETHICKLETANAKLNKEESEQIQYISVDSEITKDKMESKLPEAKKKDDNNAFDLLPSFIIKTQHDQDMNKLNLMCKLCECYLPSEDHILQHIRGKLHTNLLIESKDQNGSENKRLDSAERSYTLSTVVTDALSEKLQTKDNQSNLNEKLDAVETNYVSQTDTLSEKLQIKNNPSDLKSNTNCKICMSSCMNDCLKKCEILLNNKITVKGSKFVCTLCNRKIDTLNNIVQHTKGKSHINKLQDSGIKYLICTKSNNDGCINKKPTMNLPISELNVSVNKKCNSNSNINGTIHNVHVVSSNTSKEDFINNDETIGTKEIENRSNDDAAFNKFLYHCELCSLNVDIMDLYEHINTVIHKFGVLDISKEETKFLFKCFCCKSIIQGSNSLNNHLNSTKHLNNLINTLKHIKTNNTETSTKTASTDTKSSLCSVLFLEVENVTEMCFIFFDTSNIEICDNIRNKIIFYCSICRSVLKSHHNLMCHCQAQRHIIKLEQIFLENKQFSAEMSNKEIITINDNSFDITNDISAEIAEVLDVSPIKSKSPKKLKNKELKAAKRLNKVYYEKYLEVEDEMFSIDKNKLHCIKLNFKPLVPCSNKNFYCLACKINVSKELDLWYEHVCLNPHKKKVNKIQRNKDLNKLLKQYMQKMSKTSVECHICKVHIKNDNESIDNHINDNVHKKNHQKLHEAVDNIFNSTITQYYDNLWYSIQKFSCVPCKKNFKYKIEFIEHIIAMNHMSLKNQKFDFCIPCATLWLNYTDCYTEHCKDIVHKYLLKSKDFMVESLPECIKKLLIDVDETSNILLQETQILMNDNIQKEVTQSLENILKSVYPSIKAFVFGSRITGLGSVNSDIDIYLDYGNAYYGEKEQCLEKQHLQCIKQILSQETKQWEVKEVREDSRTPIIKLLYKPTGVQCDISITNGLSVENSKLIRSFNDAYPPCRKLILFIKKWLSCFNLPARHGFINYAVVWLVIFYLQVNSYLPSVATLIKEKNKSRPICGWETGVAEPKSDNKSVQPVPTLLLGFFKFYANFDYRYHIVCPFMGCTLTKKAFIHLHTLPEEMKPYINHIVESTSPEYFRIDSPLCVQDPFDLSHNLTKAVSSITLKYFKQYCHDSALILSP